MQKKKLIAFILAILAIHFAIIQGLNAQAMANQAYYRTVKVDGLNIFRDTR